MAPPRVPETPYSQEHDPFGILRGARHWNAAVVVLCILACLFFVSMNFQIKSGLRLAAAAKGPALCVLALVLAFPPRRLRLPPSSIIAGASLFAVGWFWGIHDPFYMDGILTSGRAQALLNGEPLNRFSLSYAALAAAFRWIGNWNWVGHLYVMLSGTALLYCLSAFFRKPHHRMLILALAFFSPHLFVLSKWLYLDIPLAAGMTATILVFYHAIGRDKTWLYWLGVALAVTTCFLKESGFLVMAPLLVLPFVVPRSKRAKAALYALISMLLGFAVFWLLYRLFRDTHQWKGEKVAWLLFNTRMLPVRQGIHWFAFAVLDHLRMLAWWAFFIPALTGLIRPKNRAGFLLIAAILIGHVIALLAASPLQPLSRWKIDPLGQPGASRITLVILLFVFSLMVLGVLLRSFSLRKIRPLDAMCWVTVASFVFVFSASARSRFESERISAMVLDWRYIAPAVPFMILLGARGSIRLLSQRNPMGIRLLMAFCLALGLELCALRAATMASLNSERSRLNGKAYMALKAQPEHIVYSHWPFFMDRRMAIDYGQFRWNSDGFEIRDLWSLKSVAQNAKRKAKLKGALVLQSDEEYQGFQSRDLFTEAVFDEKAKIHYLRPFDLGIKSHRFHRVYVGRISATPQTPRHPSP